MFKKPVESAVQVYKCIVTCVSVFAVLQCVCVCVCVCISTTPYYSHARSEVAIMLLLCFYFLIIIIGRDFGPIFVPVIVLNQLAYIDTKLHTHHCLV